MAMSYMTEVRYEKPVPPDRSHGEKRKGGHSDLPIDDDDFVDPPPNWNGISIHEDSPNGERKSDDTTDSEDMPSKNQKKLKLLVPMQGEIRTDMLDIKLHMQCMSDSVTTLISSSMEEIMNKFKENSGPETVRGSRPTSEVSTPTMTYSYLSVTTNRLTYNSHQMHFCSDFQAAKVKKKCYSKGKAKIDSVCAVEFPCFIEPPSFDLGLGFTQPSQFVAKTSKEVEVQVDSVISNVLKDAECIEQEVMKNYHKSIQSGHRSLKIGHRLSAVHRSLAGQFSLSQVTISCGSQVTGHWLSVVFRIITGHQFLGLSVVHMSLVIVNWSHVNSHCHRSLYPGHRSLYIGHRSLYPVHRS
ncbi:Hypothetical predicted protein [Olea europaea subsp. europaea]|uniref:Uncharacterized protein n=1 Tax=Olea europaea subsp. europaea TaxID=158383 RepID=A0A8S0SL66_OLEEU|nr:Hypothetical predicted protein [Olea europaea subsp. europaea]